MPKKSLSAAVLLDADLFEGIQPQSQLECKPQSQLEWQEERLNVMGNGKQVSSWLLCTANFPLPEPQRRVQLQIDGVVTYSCGRLPSTSKLWV